MLNGHTSLTKYRDVSFASFHLIEMPVFNHLRRLSLSESNLRVDSRPTGEATTIKKASAPEVPTSRWCGKGTIGAVIKPNTWIEFCQSLSCFNIAHINVFIHTRWIRVHTLLVKCLADYFACTAVFPACTLDVLGKSSACTCHPLQTGFLPPKEAGIYLWTVRALSGKDSLHLSVIVYGSHTPPLPSPYNFHLYQVSTILS